MIHLVRNAYVGTQRRRIMRTRATFLLTACVALTCGCSNDLSGTYADDAGVTRYAFAGDGDVTISVLGAEVAAEYHVDGDKVLVSSAQGTVVLTRREDRLVGPMGLELVRRND
jgi:hypothetical protein